MKRVDYILYTVDQRCRAYVGEPYEPYSGHIFDYESVLKGLGVEKRDFCGAGSMRIFDRKLLFDYACLHFEDKVIKNVVARAMMEKVRKP
jgi:hypothetical protein